MPDFTLDGPNRLLIEPAGSGNTSFDVARDLYSAWKRWSQTGAGAQYLNAFEVEGGTPIGATGLFTGTTFLLVNGWKVRAAEHDHQLTIQGNLYSEDGVVSVPTLAANATVFISGSVAAQGVATSGSVISPSDVASAVWSQVIEASLSAEEIQRILLSAIAGKGGNDGAGAFRYRDQADTKDRVVAAVANESRTSVTVDGS